MASRFRILDVDVELSGPDRLIAPIAWSYRRFAGDRLEHGDLQRVSCTDEAPPRLSVNGRPVPLFPNVDQTLQVYQQFLECVFLNCERHALLHAGVLADASEGAFLLAGPSGHGKTSLTLELVDRGHGFLSDDFAPLDLEQRSVAPYPRAVGVIPTGQAPIPAVFRRAAARSDCVRLFDKSLIDVGGLLGEERVVDHPLPLRHVILLTSGAAPQGATRVDLAARVEHADRIEERLGSIPGVEVQSSREFPEIRAWRLRLDPTRRPTRELSLLQDDTGVLFSQKSWGQQPDFTEKPHAERIRRFEAAEWLGREWLNRRGVGRLAQRYGGDGTALFLDLAAALRDARCWRVGVGHFGETADLIQRLVR